MSEAERSNLPQSAPSLREQFDLLDFLFAKNIHEAIIPESFPNLPRERIALTRFFAMDNAISGWQNAYWTTNNPKLQEKIAIIITNLIHERDQFLLEALGSVEGQADHSLIRSQVNFRQAADLTRLMEIAMQCGLVEQLTPRNFPALAALPEEHQLRLKLIAAFNQKAWLEGVRRDESRFGLGEQMSTEVKKATQALTELLTAYNESLKRY